MELSMLISDILSVITIGLCLILKVPQIICLIKSGQASGLSLKGLFLELSSYTVTMLYNYTNKHSLLTYLEYPILVFQEYILIGVVMHTKNYKLSVLLSVFFIYGVITFCFIYKILHKAILSILIPLTTPIGATSKVLQLIEIVSKKDARSVSVLTWFLSSITNFFRIYCVYMDSADVNLLINMTVSFLLSSTVMGAAMYYQKYGSSAIKSD